jgi:hypothetical protein
MSIKRSVILRGCPEQNEYGAAGEAIKPGYLVKGVTTLLKQTATTGYFATAVAVERGELGQGIDNAAGNGVLAASYATGDTVKVACPDAGDELTMWVPSGQNISEDDLLESAGTGLLIEGSTRPIFRSLETLGVVSVETAVRVQCL